MNMSGILTPKQEIINDVGRLLGNSMIDVELEPGDFDLAVKISLERYRQRSSNAVEEAYAFLQLMPNQTEYYLPQEIVDVRQIFRRGLGGTTGGTYIDPFSLAYTNLYLLQAGAGGGYTAGLLTFELFYQYQEQAGRMFRRDINYNWNVVSKKLTIMRMILGEETVLVWVTKVKPDDMILEDPFAKPWIRSYTLAVCKQILGESYSKFGQIIGPQGGTTMKGPELKSEALAEIEKLETELLQYVDNGTPNSFVILG
jgi:hypothetical protein